MGLDSLHTEGFETDPYSPQFTRRQFIRSASAAAAFSLLNTEVGAAPKGGKEAPVDPAVLLADKKKLLEAAGYLTVDYSVDPKNIQELMLRDRSIVPPVGMTLEPIIISSEVESTGNTRAMLPCPRVFGDQLPVASKTYVHAAGKPVEHTSEVIYSKSPNAEGVIDEQGFRNPFVLIKFASDAPGKHTVRSVHWVLMPTYMRMTQQKMAEHLGERVSMDITNAIQAAQGVRGDASVTSSAARTGGGKSFEIADGYSWMDKDLDGRNGGRNMFNIVRTPKGLLTVDPRNTNFYVGPQRDSLITSIGGAHIIDGAPGVARDEIIRATNGGWYDGVRSFSMAQVSTRNFGPENALLRDMKPKDEIQKYADLLKTERMKQYGARVRIPRK